MTVIAGIIRGARRVGHASRNPPREESAGPLPADAPAIRAILNKEGEYQLSLGPDGRAQFTLASRSPPGWNFWQHLVIPVIAVTVVGLLALGSIDDKVISSRGSLFLNIDADNNESGQLLEISRDTTEGGVGGTPLVTLQEDGRLGLGTPFFHPDFQMTVEGFVGPNWSGSIAAGSTSAKTVLGSLFNVATIGSHNGALNAWANLAINPGGGRVGIGTFAAPQGGLSVVAPMSTFNPTQQGVHMGNLPAPYPESTGIEIVAANDGNPYIDFHTGASPAEDFDARMIYFKNSDKLQVEQALFSVPTLEIRGGGDIVEGFHASDDAQLEPGTVVVIDPARAGALTASTEAYDTKVAGVVSGAGGINPGIHLGQESLLDGDTKVAMTGRVYVKCTTSNGPIRPGDRLTTADHPGHAMKATDAARCGGAVIGKAMSSLDDGTGLVLVLVNLQ